MIYDLIVIGAGPGSIALVAEAINGGMDRTKILVLEKADKNSWIIRKLYPEQKLVAANYKGLKADCKGVMNFYDMNKHEALDVMDKEVRKWGMNVEYECNVEKVQKVSDLFEIDTNKGMFRSRLCAVGIGIFGKPNKPSYKIPASLRKQTSYDITSETIENKKVLVVGGGDSASEYAQYLIPAGNELTLAYRGESISKRMNNENAQIIHNLSSVGAINLYTGSDINSIEDVDGRVQVNFDNERGSELFDHVVYALGGTTPVNFLKLIGVDFENDEPCLDEHFESNVPGLFIVGDLGVGRKGGSIILAFNSAYDASLRIKSIIDDEVFTSA